MRYLFDVARLLPFIHFTMKVPDGGNVDCVFTRKDTLTSDGLTRMSTGDAVRQTEKCEYGWRLRKRVSAKQSTFMHSDAQQSSAYKVIIHKSEVFKRENATTI